MIRSINNNKKNKRWRENERENQTTHAEVLALDAGHVRSVEQLQLLDHALQHQIEILSQDLSVFLKKTR